MSDNNKPRDIRHEITDVLRLLGDDYTTTKVDCDPGDSAIRITKQNSEKTMYIIAYSDPADTEIDLYDGPTSLIDYRVFYDGSLDDYTPEDIADYIIKNL
nr:MAG: hypothetical protein [Bacteriophage sp.]